MEERIALKCVKQLQEWVKTDSRAAKLSFDLQRGTELGLVHVRQLANIFRKFGFEASREADLIIMAKYLADSKDNDFDLSRFIENLMHRQFSRWQELILKNSFVDRKGSLKDLQAKLAQATVKFHTT